MDTFTYNHFVNWFDNLFRSYTEDEQLIIFDILEQEYHNDPEFYDNAGWSVLEKNCQAAIDAITN